jgi:hypothetical protein
MERRWKVAKQWKLEGSYFETCNCDVACPCVFLSSPTESDCTVVVAWHIDSGHFDGTRLDALNVALAVHSPGNMLQTPWNAALYVDDHANPGQHDALMQIFGGQAGGHPARLGSHIGKVLGASSVPIEFKIQGRKRSIKIGTVAQAEIEAIDGQGAMDVEIRNHPLAVAPGYPAVVAKSNNLRYNDHGYSWEISNKNGFFSPFSYEGGAAI